MEPEAPKKWTREQIRKIASDYYMDCSPSREATVKRLVEREVKTYISPGEVILMIWALADALGYEIKKITKEYEAVKKEEIT